MTDDRVFIFDTTLRDGEQSPGISLNTTEKLEIAHQLARLGVDIIEAGFPITSPGDFEAVQAIARQVEGPVITGLARAHVGDVDAAYGAVRDAARDLLDRLEVAGRGDRKAGLDHVDAQPRELIGDLDLLLGIQRDARRLLAVAQRGVEDVDLIGHVAFSFYVNRMTHRLDSLALLLLLPLRGE